jgi:hypothetical protein
MTIYNPCPCNSGKKLKFCCYTKFKNLTNEDLLKIVQQFPVYKCWNFQDVDDTSGFLG